MKLQGQLGGIYGNKSRPIVGNGDKRSQNQSRLTF